MATHQIKKEEHHIMTPDLLTLIISNVPNFVGFALLAYIQYVLHQRQIAQYDRLFDAYLDLLGDCLPDDEAAPETSDKRKRK